MNIMSSIQDTLAVVVVVETVRENSHWKRIEVSQVTLPPPSICGSRWNVPACPDTFLNYTKGAQPLMHLLVPNDDIRPAKNKKIPQVTQMKKKKLQPWQKWQSHSEQPEPILTIKWGASGCCHHAWTEKHLNFKTIWLIIYRFDWSGIKWRRNLLWITHPVLPTNEGKP